MAKIILVEDEINIASFIERGLREFDHEVSVVYDGNAGWELLQNESFDLLILDIIMPGMNGLELCRMYRQRFGYHSPVVMLTALGTTDDIVKGLDAVSLMKKDSFPPRYCAPTCIYPALVNFTAFEIRLLSICTNRPWNSSEVMLT